MKKISEEKMAEFNADFVKIFTSALGVGIVILGYSYTHTFFRSFGLSLYQLKMEWIDILFRGITLIQDWRVAGVFAFSILLGSLLFSIRNLVGSATKVLIVSFTVFGFLLLATWGGQALGYTHARAIWAHGAGKVAFCRIDDSDAALKPLVDKINALSLKQKIRLIHQSKEQTHLAPVFEKIATNQTTGEAYVIPTKSIIYCRVIGS